MPAMAVQVIHKSEALNFTSTADITDSEIVLADKNWTTAQFKGLILATKGNTLLKKVDMSQITFIAINTLNATSIFEGCTNLETVIWFSQTVRETKHIFARAFKDCVNLQGVINLTAFPAFGSCSYMFQNCKKLNEVIFSPDAAFPSTTTYMFKGANPDLTVSIPDEESWNSLPEAYPDVEFIKSKK
jgi:hypothetical protein